MIFSWYFEAFANVFKFLSDLNIPKNLKIIDGGIEIKQMKNCFLVTSTQEKFFDYFWSARIKQEKKGQLEELFNKLFSSSITSFIFV